MRHLPFFAVALVAATIAACSTSSEPADTTVTGEDQEVVSARLQCSIEGDRCQHGGDGELEYCVESIAIRQASSGKARLEIKRRSTVGDAAGDAPISMLSDMPAALTGARVKASWDEGENWIDLRKSGESLKGSLTLEQDFSFKITCKQTGAAACEYQGKSYRAGESFPDSDGCNTCTCNAGGIACTELACAPATCNVGGQKYRVGQSFPSEDGCNRCTCNPGGFAACTELACAPATTCKVGSKTYRVGQSFPSTDGCNTCTCSEGGYAACTELFCGG